MRGVTISRNESEPVTSQANEDEERRSGFGMLYTAASQVKSYFKLLHCVDPCICDFMNRLGS